MSTVDKTVDRIYNYFLHLSPMKILLFGYCTIIALGTLLLSLPIAVRTPGSENLLTSFFTATSATCVTGLIQFDTYTHWSFFGQAVILCLIQIGGMGFMTLCISIMTITKRKIGLVSRSLMQNSISAPQIGGIVKMTKFILLGTIVVETTGAVLLAFQFCPQYGWKQGLWFSVFHSISAFCNAGFDLMGSQAPFSSLTAEVGNWYINIIIMLLIVIGGLGFFVWHDMLTTKFRFHNMRLHTKLVLFFTVSLIFGGALLLFLCENGTASYENLNYSERIAASLFQSVSARTAGFNTVDLAALTESGRFIILVLMMIGGSPGSTAGGIKTTTFAVLLLSVITTFKNRKSTEVFGRRLEDHVSRKVLCIFTLYLSLSLTVGAIISRVENADFLNSLFESVSAIATVGLSAGMTPNLSPLSHMLLAFLMIFGRVGSLTMLLAFVTGKKHVPSALPAEKIQIG